MMDAAQQAKIAARLRESGIIVSRPVSEAGNLKRLDQLSPEQIIHDWQVRGLRVDLEEATVQADPRQLVLIP